MRHRRVTVSTIAAAIGALAIALFVVQRQDAHEAASLSVSGELVTYDAYERTLTLRTEEGDRYFVVPAGTPLHQEAKAITLSDLASANGCPAKVWYRDGQGQLIASEVRIVCALGARDTPARRQ